MDFVLKPFTAEVTVSRLANIHYFEFTPLYHTVDDSHPFCELVYVDKGRVAVHSQEYSGVLEENEMILHGANQRHSLTCQENSAPNIIIIGFECTGDFLDSLCRAPMLLSQELQQMLGEIIKEARTVFLPPYNVPNMRDMKKREHFTLGADQLIRDYLQIFLIKAFRSLGERGGAVSSREVRENAVGRYLSENFCQRISLEELCFLFNTNKTSLSKEFREVYGCTVIDYVNSLRVVHTKAQLRSGHSLTAIAESMNLSSVHYLTALFKKYTGMTPTEYVNSVKKLLE